ncbi:MAG TPA: PIN domain-containing protein [Candidatus Acidoferrum sp.]|nr:PIN domain-containing protein [Candidatus Acidoferrum sp.]
MNGLVFVDTNVLIYALDSTDPRKHEAAAVWRAFLWDTKRGRLSFQVLQEFYAQAIRKWPSFRKTARTEVRDLFAWQPIPVDALLVQQSWEIQDRYHISFWDSLIVAAAKSASCGYLLTEDLQDGQDFDGVRVINPFRNDPASVL